MKNHYLIIIFLVSFLATISGCKDPCEGVQCLNGGVCESGDCNCPSGYTGDYCELSLDPCEDVLCLNNGTCVDGLCNCVNGYTGVNCEIPPTVDPCEGVVCNNGGTCINGVCDCPSNYTGADCSTEVSPSSMRITKITVTDFTNSGWDTFPASSPDIFVTVGSGTSCSSSLWSSDFYQDAYPGPDYDFIPSSPLVISDPTTPYSICLYDDDLAGSDYMAGFYMNPYEAGQGFPSSRDFMVSGFSCTVHFTYYW